MRVASCTNLLIIGQRSVQTAKEENLNLSRRLQTWLYPALDTDANVHVCSDASLFSSYQVTQDSPMMMENGSHASVRSVGTIDLKLTSGKIV
jgi:hypothetical protein